MARLLNRIATRMLLLAGLMTFITMATGMTVYYLAVYYQIGAVANHMPPRARAELDYLVRTDQRGTDKYFDLYDRYGGLGPGMGDIGFIAVIALISTTAGGGVAMVLARRISKPITEVARAAAQVSTGNRSARVERGKIRGETAELVDSFNRMAAAIESYERERTVLTAGIAHELRTPLTILKGRLHGLADGIIDPAAGEADRLLRQVEHLSRLVEDLRTLAHADAGELDLDLRQIDLESVLRTAVGDLRSSAAEQGVSVIEAYQAATVRGDPLRLTQVFTNILANAISHAPSGSRVTVSIVDAGQFAVASILDEGEGFSPEDAPRLFIPFWQAGADRNAGRPGNGAGLTLAAKLAEAHGGKIVAKNRTDRSGACFAIRIPISRT